MARCLAMSDSKYVVRLPEHFLDKLHEGEIRASELLTISILFKWANWTTGVVPCASAGGLETWSNNAYCADTFCKALQRLEQMGHITRLMKVGSNRDYPVMLHNYPKLGEDGKTELINQQEVIPMKPMMISPEDARASRKSPKGRSEDAHEDAHEDTHEQTSDKVLSQSSLKSSLNNLSDVLSQIKPQGKKEGKVKKENGSSLRSEPPDSALEILKPLDHEPCELELVKAQWLNDIWRDKTKHLWLTWVDDIEKDKIVADDRNGAIRLLDAKGWTEALDTLMLTFECPKTAGIGWTDWWYWVHKFELTQKTTTAWRNKVMAAEAATHKSVLCGDCRVEVALPSRKQCMGCWIDWAQLIIREYCTHKFVLNDGICLECGHQMAEPGCCNHERLAPDGSKCVDCGKLSVTAKSSGLHNLPGSAAPPPNGQAKPEPQPEPVQMCPHGNPWNSHSCPQCDEGEVKRNQCGHGNDRCTCDTCLHPPNATCRWKECSRIYHSPDRNPNHWRFCTPDCQAKFNANEEAIRIKHGIGQPQEKKYHLAGFLDGEAE
jgi:hypothetical protein